MCKVTKIFGNLEILKVILKKTPPYLAYFY